MYHTFGVPHCCHQNRKITKSDQVEPLYAKYGVDVVLSGHIHRYSRFCPVFREGFFNDCSVNPMCFNQLQLSDHIASNTDLELTLSCLQTQIRLVPLGRDQKSRGYKIHLLNP